MIDDSALRAWLRDRAKTDRATLALATWEMLSARVPRLPLPVVSLDAGEDGDTVQLSWVVRDVVVEIDAFPGSFGWFTRDRATDVYDGSEENVVTLPPEAWAALQRLVA